MPKVIWFLTAVVLVFVPTQVVMAQQLAIIKRPKYCQLTMVWSVLILAPTLLDTKQTLLTSYADSNGKKTHNLQIVTKPAHNIINSGILWLAETHQNHLLKLSSVVVGNTTLRPFRLHLLWNPKPGERGYYFRETTWEIANISKGGKQSRPMDLLHRSCWWSCWTCGHSKPIWHHVKHVEDGS